MNAHRACDDFHRTNELRRAARAGRWSAAASAAGCRSTSRKAMPIQRVLEAAAADAAAAPERAGAGVGVPARRLDLLDTLVPLHAYGRYADLRPKLKVQGVPLGGHGPRHQPVAGPRHQRRRQGALRARQDRLPAGHRLLQPGPVPLPLAPLLGDRPDHRPLGAGLAGPLARPRRRPRQPAPGDLDGLRPVAGDALGPRPGRRGGLARRRRLLDPRRLGRRLRRGDGRLRPARQGQRRRPRAERLARGGAAGQAGGGPARRPTPSATATTRWPRRSPTPRRATSASACATSRR